MSKQKEQLNNENSKNSKGTKNNQNKGKGKGKSKPKNKQPKQSDNKVEATQVEAENAEKPIANINDWTDYYPNEDMAQQLQSYSFNEYVSVESNLGLSNDNEDWKFTLPNLMSVLVNPCVPITDLLTGQSGITSIALRNFVDLVFNNARNALYGPQDPILASLAVGNMLSTRSWLMRALCVAFKVDYRNRSFPDSLIAAMHINASDLRDHLAQYRIRFNTLIATANKIPFPGDVKYFDKCSRMFANVYVDDDKSIMAQTYMFNPRTVWVIDEAYDSDGTGLRTVDFVTPGATYNFSHYLDVFESQINALLNSSTLNYVYADILRLAQKGNIKTLLYMDYLPELVNFECSYSDEVQLWIHNMNVVGMPRVTPSTGFTPLNDVKSDAGNNSIKYKPEWVDGTTSDTTYHVPPAGILLDFYTDSPSVEDKIAATRLSAAWNTLSPAVGGNYLKSQVAFLDWYVAQLEIFTDAGTAPLAVTSLYSNSITKMAALSHFRWNPRSIIQKNGSYDGSSRVQAVMGELNYYTIVDYSMLKRIYDYEIIELLSLNIIR